LRLSLPPLTRVRPSGVTAIPSTSCRCPTSDVNWLAFTPDGQAFVSISRDATLKYWNLNTRQAVKTLTGHVGEIFTVAVHRNEKWVASAGRDQVIRLWDLTQGQEIAQLRGHTGWIYGVNFSPDGRLLASGSVDKLVKLWSINP